jgi:hypothetical protein
MLPCVNCGTEVPEKDVKFFTQILVCPDCYFMAERLYTRGKKELSMLLLLLKESIRVAIVQKQLQFSPKIIEDMPQEDLFGELTKLAQVARARGLNPGKDPECPPDNTKTRSRETTPPSAPTAGGQPPSD